MNENERKMWEKCAAFHGHECGGLALGFKAAMYAEKVLGAGFSRDEELICISENDACCVDAIQVLLGCTAGKGNLFFHLTGKIAFTFFSRDTGDSIRIIQRSDHPKNMSRAEEMKYYLSLPPEEIYEQTEVKLRIPGRAVLSSSVKCDDCGEETGELWIRCVEGRKVCPDCFRKYHRIFL